MCVFTSFLMRANIQHIPHYISASWCTISYAETTNTYSHTQQLFANFLRSIKTQAFAKSCNQIYVEILIYLSSHRCFWHTIIWIFFRQFHFTFSALFPPKMSTNVYVYMFIDYTMLLEDWKRFISYCCCCCLHDFDYGCIYWCIKFNSSIANVNR